ncbi:tetratricopeptide repeat protein [Treponema phagedenis]|uniref:tetratricopeptide repeat protein n=1 Tax=Treponema phagedenis TaxID=162 RepID=UPI00197E72EA|nr:tetratricopeptide repeat protein [Treponema phagedenis]QSH94506.1 hypothetical protein C5O78_05530 [Treponema phagedenis]
MTDISEQNNIDQTLEFSSEPGLNLDDDSKEDSKAEQIAQLSKEGYALLKIEDTDKAIEEFKKILELEEHNNYALVGLGDAARKKENCKEAIEYYTECLTYHPGNNYALFGLADCYKSLNQYAKAIQIWEQYLLHDDTNITVLTRIADAYRKTHDFQNSKRLYTKVLAIEKNNPYALIGLGHLHYDFKKYKEALFYWQKVVDTNPENIDIRVLTSIGNCYRKMKLFDKGAMYFEKTLEKAPKNFYGLFGLADCYRGLGQQEKSIKYWAAILEKDPKNKVILTRVGDAYRHIGMYDKAEETYQKALDIDYDSYATLGLAILRKIQGKYAEAITALDRLLQNDKKNYRIYLELADCYKQIGQRHKAVEILKSFQQYGIKNQSITDTLNELAEG